MREFDNFLRSGLAAGTAGAVGDAPAADAALAGAAAGAAGTTVPVAATPVFSPDTTPEALVEAAGSGGRLNTLVPSGMAAGINAGRPSCASSSATKRWPSAR